jgi:hypothetical protein
VPLGHLTDRRGPRGVAMLLAAAALVAFLFVRSNVAFVAVASLYGTSQCGLTAARQALLARLVAPADRTRVRAVLSRRSTAASRSARRAAGSRCKPARRPCT